MKKSDRIVALTLAVMLLGSLFVGCGASRPDAGPDGQIVLSEPTYAGESEDGYPLFHFSWSRAKKLWYYDMAIYLSMAGYEERSRVSFTDRNETSVEIPFLKGIGVDTATYRIKIRPLSSENEAWSDVWQIDFVDGVYTVTGGAPDFDAPAPAKEASASSSTEMHATVAHTFPEPLLQYIAEEMGRDSVDITQATLLSVQVNHCEYGEPAQAITDPETIAAAAEAVSQIRVTGDSDNMSSTATYSVFSFADAAGKTIASFAFQEGMLMENDGRYPVSGLETLFSVEGIMLEDEWAAYWMAEDEKEKAYAEGFTVSYPASVFALSGYNASLLADIDPMNIDYISIRVNGNEYAGTLDTQDPAVIRVLYESLSAMRVVEKLGEDDAEGQAWSVHVGFHAADDPADAPMRTAYVSFVGDCFLSDLLDGGTEMPYTVDGLPAFFDCTDADVLRYLKESRNARRPKPKYS